MKWKDKIAILLHIASDLQTIHSKNRIHRDLHSGNILQNTLYDAYIADLGLLISINMVERSNRCGVLPYMAPEVLNYEPYTTASDIYSFGIIMWEISAGMPLQYNQNDINLIRNGFRPNFSKEIPLVYTDLVINCLNITALERPSASDIQKLLDSWTKEDYYIKRFKSADIEIDNFKSDLPSNLCENSIIKYSSINLEFKSINT
ncbi:kinase-like domain-containing protein, partial [Gigaspora rosea]